MQKFSELVGTATSGVIGPAGPAGAQGPAGPQGPVGPAGPSVTASSIDRNALGGSSPLSVGSGGTGVSSLGDLQEVFGGLNVARVSTSGVNLNWGYVYLVDSSGSPSLLLNLPPRTKTGRLRIIDVSGTFFSNPVGLKPAAGTKINALANDANYVSVKPNARIDVYNLDFYDTAYRVFDTTAQTAATDTAAGALSYYKKVDKVATIGNTTGTYAITITQLRLDDRISVRIPNLPSPGLTVGAGGGTINIPIDTEFRASTSGLQTGVMKITLNGTPSMVSWMISGNNLSIGATLNIDGFTGNQANVNWSTFTPMWHR